LKLSFTKYRLNCIHPFGISRSSYNYYDRVYIFIEQDGIIGRGEAAPTERYNESIPQIIERLKSPIELPDKITEISELIKIVDEKVGDIQSLRSACVNALIDWYTQSQGMSFTEYYKIGNIVNQPTSFTIAIGNTKKIEQKIAEAKNFKIIKVKLGTDYDKQIITTIRKFTNKPIRVDANEGWDLPYAIEMSNWLADQNVELIEQPLPTNKLSDMLELKAESALPLIADESCHTTNDIEKLVSGFDGINIKLTKCGGLDEAIQMIDIAKDNLLKVMLGCMVESSVGITAIGQLAACADYLDLDGNLLIDNDPYHGLFIKNGVPVLPNSAGLGIRLKNEYQINFLELK